MSEKCEIKEQADKLIEKCEWRKNFDVCVLEVLPCKRAVETGKCPILIEFFKEINNETV